METTVKLTKGGGSVVFKIREMRGREVRGVKGKGWKKLLYFSCKCGHKGQFKELSVIYERYGCLTYCPKCEMEVELLEKCPQCESPSMKGNEAGIIHTHEDGQSWEIWPCKKCQSLLKIRSKKVLGFAPSFLFY